MFEKDYKIDAAAVNKAIVYMHIKNVRTYMYKRVTKRY